MESRGARKGAAREANVTLSSLLRAPTVCHIEDLK